MKYIIEFSKTGTICYTSHLDIMKVFKRAFKKSGIEIAYSQGFNPHPKMGFGQPLSLGYWGLEEYVEFETAASEIADENMPPEDMLKAVAGVMPEGLRLNRIIPAPWLRKTLAAENVAAEYIIEIPQVEMDQTGEELRDAYMSQEQILVLKKQKKKPEPVQIDIKNKIRTIDIRRSEEGIYIHCILDSGSESNLSPELLIQSFTSYFHLDIPRYDMNVARKRLFFKEDTEKAIRADSAHEAIS
ncbi:MAG: TIGR03936 family radical SAM-associated protein [Bacillota bacterium]|nr:TIGR03936 family radical SAM-associated protein [Bacillota bacterium]